jgi:hypothetical protein
MSNTKCQRKRFFVDPKVQGVLVTRVVLYWFACIFSITLMLLCWRIVTGPARLFYTHFDAMWFHFGPALIASFLLLPLVVIDVIRFSNRFVGPMLRLKRSMGQLARGEDVQPIEFREGDFWTGFAADFNAIRDQIREKAAPSAARHEATEEEEPAAV